MTREEILDEWSKDCIIDDIHLDSASLETPKIHSKYWRYLSNERLILKKYETDLKQLALKKYEFFTQGPTKETVEKGWELPAKGTLIKAEADRFLEADSDIINLSLKIANQKEKTEILNDIIKELKNRNWIIRNVLEFRRFESGG